jgi:hypothetical protein
MFSKSFSALRARFSSAMPAAVGVMPLLERISSWVSSWYSSSLSRLLTAAAARCSF